ncbi:hypothetical protein D3C85_1625830 [compost metagenome]
MAKDVAVFKPGYLAAIQMQVGPADGGCGDAQEDIVVLQQYRVWNRLHPHVVLAVIRQCFHLDIPNRRAAPGAL